MPAIWFVTNVRSGSYSADQCESIVEKFESIGWPVERVIRFPDEDLPDRKSVESARIDHVAIFTGDGTINALNDRMSGWAGGIIVLPGGTMNLLSRNLHGDVDALTIIERLPAAKPADPVPVIEGGGTVALCGTIAGPTTKWGAVREALRDADIGEVAETVPVAWRSTIDEATIGFTGESERYPALFFWPTDEGMRVRAFTADGVGEMLRHGWAWAAGDFREGPHVDLATCDRVNVTTEGDQIDLLIDGEEASVPNGTEFCIGRSKSRFISTIEPE